MLCTIAANADRVIKIALAVGLFILANRTSLGNMLDNIPAILPVSNRMALYIVLAVGGLLNVMALLACVAS
jgi:hypothetical protein